MIRGPGDLPSVDTPPGASASIRLSVHHPTGGRAARDHLRQALLSGLLADAAMLDEDQPDQPWPGEFPGGEWAVLQKRSFPKAGMFKLVAFGPSTDARTTVTVGYAAAADDEGEDSRDVVAATSACSVSLLCELQGLVREDLGPGCLPALCARFLGIHGGWTFSELLRLRLMDVPIVTLAPDRQGPDGFLQGAEALLGGLALVVRLDPKAVAELADVVGREMSCPGGGARIYRPGWSKDDNPGRHPAWSRQQVLPKGERERFAEFAFCNEVFRELFVRPRERDRERIGELERQVAELAEHGAGTDGPKRDGGKGRSQETKTPPEADVPGSGQP